MSDETLDALSQLEAIGKVVGEPYGLDGLPLVERVVLLRKQLDLDNERCEEWKQEVAILRLEREAYRALFPAHMVANVDAVVARGACAHIGPSGHTCALPQGHDGCHACSSAAWMGQSEFDDFIAQQREAE